MRDVVATSSQSRFDRIGRIVNGFEEGFIALLFAAMVLVTFIQVVLRYGFNTGFVWALELTTYLFAWLVLFGMSYGVKVHSHLGVDAFVKLFDAGPRRVFGLLAVTAGLVYGTIMLIGSWEYVWKLFRIGIESEDLPIPQWLPMAILPIGVALLMFRLGQAGWKIYTREQEGLLLGDEAQDAIKQHLEKMEEAEDQTGVPPQTAAGRGP